MSREKIPLDELIEEAGTEYLRRCRTYPVMVAKGQMRDVTSELKISRMANIHNVLCWVNRHSDQLREWMAFAKSVASAEERAAIEFDAPMEVDGGEVLSDKQEAAE